MGGLYRLSSIVLPLNPAGPSVAQRGGHLDNFIQLHAAQATHDSLPAREVKITQLLVPKPTVPFAFPKWPSARSCPTPTFPSFSLTNHALVGPKPNLAPIGNPPLPPDVSLTPLPRKTFASPLLSPGPRVASPYFMVRAQQHRASTLP